MLSIVNSLVHCTNKVVLMSPLTNHFVPCKLVQAVCLFFNNVSLNCFVLKGRRIETMVHIHDMAGATMLLRYF